MCSSVEERDIAQAVVSTCEGFDHHIDPAQWMHLQFGLFSFPIHGPQLGHYRLWCVLCCPVCGKVYMKDPLLLIGKSSLCGDNRFPLKNLSR